MENNLFVCLFYSFVYLLRDVGLEFVWSAMSKLTAKRTAKRRKNHNLYLYIKIRLHLEMLLCFLQLFLFFKPPPSEKNKLDKAHNVPT